MIKTVDHETPKARANVWIYLISIIPATTVALLAPDNVLSQHPSLDHLTMILRNLLPSIDRLAVVSSFPEVTRLVLAVEWTILPIQTILFIVFRTYAVKVDLLRERRFLIAFGLPILVGVFVWCVALLYEVTPTDLQGNLLNESLLRSVSTSRLGLGIISSIFLSGTALVVGVLLVWARLIPHVYFGYDGGLQR
jgi:hypothetical protein